jgi:hypothetical protein
MRKGKDVAFAYDLSKPIHLTWATYDARIILPIKLEVRGAQ